VKPGAREGLAVAVSYKKPAILLICSGLIRIECILLKFHWGMKALTEAVSLHVENVLRSTLSYPNETSKECIQIL
jgi:hypothetical protein